MSTTIDEKVVEMRFDNRDFEHNIKDTMKTLEEFKKQLNFSGASDGLENVGAAANKLNFNNLSNAIDTVNERFSTLGIIGMRVLENITDRAMAAGERLVKSLTITPVIDGLREYELQIGSTQTIMANTGESVEVVNKALDDLNDYADLTIYNFSQMTKNVGIFTATLGKGSLEMSTRALKGLGNWAAYAGASAEDMARASQYLAQGLQSGYISLQSWRSVIHTAGMAGQNFQDAFKETAREVGIDVDSLIDKAGSFKDSLKDGWLTTDVFMKTMDKFANDPAMTDAATKIKTFSQLVDVIKEALGTGWAQTWRLIIGDFEQAKETFTNIGDFLTGPKGIITRISKARNDLVESAMGKTIGEFAKKFKDLVEPIEKSADSVKKVVDSVQDYTKVVDEIISGKWGNGQSRWDKLTEAGYDWAHAQNLVNERLGSSVRHAENFSEKQEELVQSEEKVSEATKNYIEELVNLSDAELKAQGYNDEQIKDFRNLKETADKLGLSVTELIDKSDKLNGRYMLIESFANVGRTLISIFKSIGEAFISAFPPITADTIFNIITGMYRLSNIIKNYVEGNAENLTRTLKGLFAILSVIANIVKGVLRIGFTALKSIMTIFGKTTSGVLDVTANLGDILVKISDILNKYIIGAFDTIINLMNNGIGSIKDWILNNTNLGEKFEWLKNKFYETITSIKDYLTNNEKLKEGLDKLKNKITEVKNNIIDWFKNNEKLNTIYNTLSETFDKFTKSIKDFIENNETLKNIFENIQEKIDKAKKSLEEWFNTLSNGDSGSIGKNIIDGLANGITYAAGKVWEAILKIAQKIKDIFFKFFNMGSPSKETETWGKYIIEGLKNGLKDNCPKLYEVFKTIYEAIKDLSFEMVSSIIWPLTTIFPQLKFLDLPRQFLNLFKACGMNSLEGLQIGLQQDHGVIKAIKDVAQKIIKIFKGEIDSNSPSKVFIAIGGFIMSGLLIGLQQGFIPIPDAMKGFADKIIDLFKNIDFGKILAVGVIVGSFLILKKAIDVLKTFAKLADRLTAPLKGLENALSGLGKMFTAKGEAAVLAAKSNMIKSIAESILMIAAAMFILSKIENMGQAAIAVGIIAGVFIALFVLMSKFNKNMVLSNEFIMNLNAFSNMIKSLAICMLLLSVVMKIIGNLSPEEMITGSVVLTAFMVIVGTLVAVTTFGGPYADKAAAFISKIGGAFLLLAVAMKIVCKLSPDEMITGSIILTVFMVIVGTLVALTIFGGPYADKAAIFISKIGGAFLLLAVAMRILGGLSPEEMITGSTILTAFMIIVGTLIAISKLGGIYADKAGQMILSIGGAFVLLGIAMKILGNLSPREITQGGLIIGGFILLVMGLIYLSKFAGREAHKAGLMILEISAGFLLLSAAMKILGTLKKDEIMKGVGIIAAFSILVGILIGISKAAGPDADKAGIMILKISFAIAILTGCLIALTFLDTQKMLTSLGALCTIIGVLGVAIFLIGQVKDSIAKAIPAILLLSVLSVGITAFLAWLDHVNAKASIETASALSEVLLAMSAAALILSKIQFINPGAITSMFILGGVIAELAIILGIMDKLGVKASVETATSLSILLVTMSGCLAILALVGSMGPAAMTGAMNLIAVVSVLGLFIGGLGALVMLFSELGVDLENFINNGGKILSAIGKVIGEFIGSLIDGFNVGATNSLPEITKKISESMNNLEGFISGANNVKSDTVKGAGYLAAAILELTAAEFISGILAITPNIIGMAKLGFGLSAFIKAAGPFFEAVTNINPKVLEGTKNLADAILALSEAELVTGITKLLGLGDKDLGAFGTSLEELGKGLKSFIAALPQSFNIDLVKSACEVISKLAEVNKSIPNTGGLIGNIMGENDLGTFGNNLETLGSGLRNFIDNIGKFGSNEEKTAESAANAIQKIADANSYVQNTGGFIAAIIGDNDLGDFGADIGALGKGLGSFVKQLNDNGFTSTDSPALIEAACACIEKIAGLNSSLKDNDWYSKIIGSSNLEKFSEEIPKLATGINDFVKALPDFTAEKLEVVRMAVDALLAIGSLGALDLSNIATNMIYFSGSLSDLGVGISTFFNTLTEIGLETIQEGIGKVNELIAMASTIAETNIEQVSVFSDSLVKVANEGVIGFCNAFDGDIPKIRAKQAVVKMLIAALSGAMAMKKPIVDEFIEISEACIAALRSYYQAFYDAGLYLAQGFANGITDNGNYGGSINAAAEMGRRAAEALRNAMDEHSPSKVSEGIGNYFGEGLVIGIKDYFGKVYNTAFNVGDMAKEGLSNAIAKISKMVEDGIDTSPTIRPVLDLSEVEQGAAYLGSMFGTNSVGLRENINSISNGFNSRIQNGSGLDLLNAINKLEATVRGSNGNTLNIYTQELDSEKLDQIVRHVNKELGVIF